MSTKFWAQNTYLISMITILIADDHQVLLDGFVSIFDDIEDIEVIGTVSNGKEVLDFVSHKSPDITLLDINMPVLNGVETCRRLTRKYPDLSVIALSMYDQSSYYKRMIQYGAKGYLLKNDNADEIVQAIREVHNGGTYVSSKMQLAMQGEEKPTSASPSSFDVSGREIEVLQEIAGGLTDQQIGEKLFISHHTVTSHRKKLFQKLQANNAAQLVRIAMEKGLI